MTRLTGRHVAAMFAVFFGTIFAVNIAMAFLASDVFSGLIAKNGYVAGQALAERRVLQERARKLGWQVEIGLADGYVTVDAKGTASVVAVAERPVRSSDDLVIDLVRHPDGSLRSARRLPAGNWIVLVTLSDGESRLEERRRFLVGARA